MGNSLETMRPPPKRTVTNHQFLYDFRLESYNGLCLNDNYLPEEVIIQILSHLNANDILKASLVCKRWFNLTRSPSLWMEKYERHYPNKRSKNLDWYVYYALFSGHIFDSNLLKNGNGQEQYKHWKIIKNFGDSFLIEKTPQGADPLPEGVEEFSKHKSCFATSYYECDKLQEIFLSPLACRIVTECKPDIYVSEWTAGRFDCGSIYILTVRLYGKDYRKAIEQNQEVVRYSDSDTERDEDSEDILHVHGVKVQPLLAEEKRVEVRQWEGRAWSKVEMLLKDYPDGVETIVFQHMGQDTQFWKGHYGSKMAGGVVKLLFDSLKEKPGIPQINSQISQEPQTPDEEPQTSGEKTEVPDKRSQNPYNNPLTTGKR